MNSNIDREDPLDRQLRAGLRDTTPEFEARFNTLRRALAQERPRVKRLVFARWFGGALGAIGPARLEVVFEDLCTTNTAFWEWDLDDDGSPEALVVAGPASQLLALNLRTGAVVGASSSALRLWGVTAPVGQARQDGLPRPVQTRCAP